MKVFIFDIDGTLSKMDNKRSPYNYLDVLGDIRNERVCDLHDILVKSNKCIFVSGRPDSCRDDTQTWLKTHLDVSNGVELYMRSTGDNRSDSIVKFEILQELLAKWYEIMGVFDDRDRVVEMWRENGIQCYQVDYGNF